MLGAVIHRDVEGVRFLVRLGIDPTPPLIPFRHALLLELVALVIGPTTAFEVGAYGCLEAFGVRRICAGALGTVSV